MKRGERSRKERFPGHYRIYKMGEDKIYVGRGPECQSLQWH